MGDTFGYYINLDERGSFFADVRDIEGKTVFEIHGSEIFDDGFMQHKNDTEGLREYLQDLGIIGRNDDLLSGTGVNFLAAIKATVKYGEVPA